MLVFNYEIGRWALVEQQLDLLAALSSEALTVEALGAIYSTVEDIPGSIDSPAFSGGVNYLAMFGSDKKLADFSGSNAAMTLDTAEQRLHHARRTREPPQPLVRRARSEEHTSELQSLMRISYA